MKLRNAAAAIGLTAFAMFSTASFAATEKKDAQAIESAVSGSWRSSEAKGRDSQRHPVDALEFWGLKPGMTILEIQPGGAEGSAAEGGVRHAPRLPQRPEPARRRLRQCRA